MRLFPPAHLAAACLAASLAACNSSSGGGSAPPAETVTVTASRTSVVANGTNTVTFRVTASGGGPIDVSATKGTFAGGTARTQVAGAAGDVVLTTCDAAADATCAGTARVTAVRPGGAASAAVTFGTLALCTSDCNADAACSSSSRSCTLTGGGTGVCSGSPPAATCGAVSCTPTQTPETSCADGLDNDCDGSRDCADADCDGRTCGTSSVCRSGACTDLSAGAGIALTATRTRLPPDGVATATITATVVQDTQPAANVGVIFTATAGTIAPTATTGADGRASVTYTASATAGTATITASLAAVPSVSAPLAITMPGLGSIRLGSTQYQVMGVRFSGFQETNQVSFQVLDAAGLAYPAGLLVNFTHDRLGDSFIGASPSCVAGPPASCTASAVTNDAGLAVVQLTSGRIAGVVSITASSSLGGTALSFSAGNLAIVGAKPSGAHITVNCSPKNVPALTNQDCSFSHYGGTGSQVTCNATFADRFNNALGVPTLATFYSEAGSTGPPALSPAYDPARPPSQQTGLGVASSFVNVSGGKVPIDVAPFDGEARIRYLDACGDLVHSPRDGLVTVLVTAIGEEGFVDLNGNGVRDAGEPFIDMGEPYLDANDNGVRDPNEAFIDVNNNQQYDPPNGAWDPNTTIWAETRILYSGFPGDGSTFYTAGTLPFPTPAAPFSVLGATTGPTTASYNVLFIDGNLNQVASTTAFALSTVGQSVVTPTYTVSPSRVDNLGMTFTQQYCDHPTSPTACGNTCQTIPCYVVTNVGACDLPARAVCNGFSYGNVGQLSVRGACNAAAGETVVATATLNSVVSRLNLGGNCTP